MKTIEMDMIQTVGFAIIFLLLGRFLRSKVKFFRDFAIPSPVIGGLIFSIFHTILRVNEILAFEFDTTLQSFFMIIFFTSIGFGASTKILKAAGPSVLKFLALAAGLVFLQNLLALGLGTLIGVEPGMALMTGSTPMSGGHGTAAAIAPEIERATGISGINTLAVTAATFGLIAGSLMGGPLANSLIMKNNLVEKKQKESYEADVDASLLGGEARVLDGDKINMGFFVILVAMFFGSYITNFLNGLLENVTDKAKLPAYIGAMFIGIFARYLSDKRLESNRDFVPVEEVEIVGSVGLNIFLAMALMTVRLWELLDLFGQLAILMLGQTILMYVYARFITFKVMGKNYDAAVLAAGHCGFGMGATPNGVANMESVVEKFIPSRTAFFVLPIVGGMFIDFVNIFIITAFTFLI